MRGDLGVGEAAAATDARRGTGDGSASQGSSAPSPSRLKRHQSVMSSACPGQRLAGLVCRWYVARGGPGLPRSVSIHSGYRTAQPETHFRRGRCVVPRRGTSAATGRVQPTLSTPTLDGQMGSTSLSCGIAHTAESLGSISPPVSNRDPGDGAEGRPTATTQQQPRL